MCATLPYEDALDLIAAYIAGFTGALVDLKVVLETASAVDPVDAGTVAADAFLQYLTHGRQEAFSVAAAKAVGEAEWVQFGLVQGFVSIDVAHTCQEVLVKE